MGKAPPQSFQREVNPPAWTRKGARTVMSELVALITCATSLQAVAALLSLPAATDRFLVTSVNASMAS